MRKLLNMLSLVHDHWVQAWERRGVEERSIDVDVCSRSAPSSSLAKIVSASASMHASCALGLLLVQLVAVVSIVGVSFTGAKKTERCLCGVSLQK